MLASRMMFGLALLPMALAANGSQAIVEDTGSTNVPGLRVLVQTDGRASVEERNGSTHDIRLSEQLCRRLFEDLKAIGPLDRVPVVHCMKSASFGSRITVEFDGAKSPDVSCPGASDPHLEALEKDAREILGAARQAAGIHGRRVFSAPAPSVKQ
ncbi:MAG: hypothetical protein JO091_10730 [Acidobacteriaceae bacterium]|nr:hypothetical protein [Acidobacteriaceae bacterium]